MHLNAAVHKNSSSNIITNMFTPRSYQVELLECALNQNTIVCVNTQAGKQFLSTMLIRELMIKVDDENGSDDDLKLAILLLNQESYVQSLGELFRDHLNVNVMSCTKEDCYNYSSEEWKNVFKSHQVLTISPELLVHAFDKDSFLAKMVDLLIFDECHLVCNENHPYRKIMKVLDDHNSFPNILGLTMSLLSESATAESLKEKIVQMETLLRSTAQTATDLIALDRYSLMKPTENIILSADTHKQEENTDSHLVDEIKMVLKHSLQWLESCQIHSNVRVQVIDWEIESLAIRRKNISGGNDLKLDNETTSNRIFPNNNSIPNSLNTSSEAIKYPPSSEGGDNNESDTKSKYSQYEDVCSTPRSLLQEVLLVLDVLGPWCVYKLVEQIIKQLHKVLLGVERRLKHATPDNTDEEPTSGTSIWQKMLLQYVNTKLQLIYAICHRHMGSRKAIDLKFVSPKVHRLLQVLKEYKPVSTPDTQQSSQKYNDRRDSRYVSWWQDSDEEDEDDDGENAQEKKNQKSNPDENNPSLFSNTLCGIVFVEEKYVAMMLHRLLREISKDDKGLNHVNSSHLGSSGSNMQSGLDSAAVDKSKQEEILRKFRCHETNLLITISSLEDCAHIPKCNLVVRFDAPRSYRAYAQSKSRARASSSAYVMLIRDSEKNEFMEKLQEYKRIEQVLQGPVTYDSVLEGDEDVVEDYDDIIPPYSPSDSNVVASMSNAIKIVNRYCSRLPSDPFTHLTPRCEVVEDRGGGYYDDESMYHCILQLPINSHLREPIKGKSMPTVKLAQQAVAVEACEDLHLCGELDDNLMPIGKETVKYAEELDPWKPEQSSVLGRPGSTKRRQAYAKDIPGTPIFTRSGEETARLRLCRSYIMFSEQQIKLIKSFHRYVFSDILRVDRVPLIFKPEVAENQLLIILLNKTPGCGISEKCRIDIDWKFMVKTDLKRRTAEKLQKDPWYCHRMTEKKKQFKFVRDIYEDAVVVRNYGNCDQPNRYYVAEIKDHLNPASPFPSADYMSYKHYYEAKYGVDIRCSKQPLLDVDHTPSRLNLLTPRHTNRKGKPASRDKKSKPKNPVIFVSELCDVHPVPASLWRKAVCLPSALYRIGQLLISEELRRDVADNSGVVVEKLPLGHTWSDIELNYSSENLDDVNPTLASSTKSPLSETSTSDANVRPVTSTSEGATVVGETIRQIVDNVVTNVKDSTEGSDDSAKMMSTDEYLSSHPDENTAKNSSNYVQDHPEVQCEPGEFGKAPSGSSDSPSDTISTRTGRSDDNLSLKDSDIMSDDFNKLCNISGDKLSFSPENMSKTPPVPPDECEDSYFSDDYQANFLSDEELQLFKEQRKKRKKKMKVNDQSYSWFSIEKQFISESLNFPDVSCDKIGPGPETILQALTLSNASDGFNLERMEMLGDSFLKHAVTLYLYCTYPDAHEGKLSYMRSKKVSNYNLYRIGKAFGVAGKMTAHIFDPIVNWLPAGYTIGAPGLDEDGDLLEDEVEIGVWTGVSGEKKQSTSESNDAASSDPTAASQSSQAFENDEEMYEEDEIRMIDGMLGGCLHRLGGNIRGPTVEKKGNNGMMGIDFASVLSGHASMHFTDKAALKQSAALSRSGDDFVIDTWTPLDSFGKPLSTNDPLMLDLHTQHSLSDKSIADSVEALLGAYLNLCGHRTAQLLLCHLGLVVLPKVATSSATQKTVDRFGHLVAPPNNFVSLASCKKKVDKLLHNLRSFEKKMNYNFKNKAYLLQAFTHASYYYNTVTDCYQRLEFLGDAVLDFLVTRHLCADERQHSPGALTDLRCALVNNTIFASLAVRYDFHKYFKSISPELQKVIEEFVLYQQRQEETQGMDAQLLHNYGDSVAVSPEELDQSFMDGEEEAEETEDVEVPKALGDIFESVAGAVFMDSGMDLEAVWRVYSVMMLPLIEKFSSCVPRSPVRELLEMEPETAKFSCAEKRFDGKIRVTVEIIGKGRFKGVGRSYRIAKSAAARRALRFLKRNC